LSSWRSGARRGRFHGDHPKPPRTPPLPGGEPSIPGGATELPGGDGRLAKCGLISKPYSGKSTSVVSLAGALNFEDCCNFVTEI